jgi:MFS family permease
MVFVVTTGCYVLDMSPSPTWIDTNSDGIHLTYAARYLYPAHKGSAPLYLLLGHLMVQLPMGTDFWKMVLMSVIGTVGACLAIYLIIRLMLKDKKNNRVYAIIGMIIFAGSALIISQTVIAKYYPLVSMCGLFGYYFALKKKWLWSTVALGAGIAIHPIIVFFIVPLLVFNFRKYFTWKSALIIAGFMMFYLYVPLVTRFNPSPLMWGNSTIPEQIRDMLSTAGMLTGGLAIYDLPKRVLETIGIIGVSLGLALIIDVWWMAKEGKKWWKNQLTWLFLLPIIYFITDLSPQTYVYMYPAIAFGAIIAVIQLEKMNKVWLWSIVAIAVIMFGYNVNYFDIGRTLDKNMSATKFMNVELPKINGEGAIFIPKQDWEWAATFSYNKDNGKDIIPVCYGTLASEQYRQMLKDEGVRMNDEIGVDMPQRADLIAESIIEDNSNVWTTVTTDASTYGAEVVVANFNNSSFVGKIYPTTTRLTSVKWTPDSPYGIITGSIEVTKWVMFDEGNRSMFVLGMLGFIGFAFAWFVDMIVFKKKEWKIENVKDKFKNKEDVK